MAKKNIISTLLVIFLITLNFRFLEAQTWIKAAFYDSSSNLPACKVNSALFTHIYYGFAAINPSTYQLSFHFSTQSTLSTFTSTIKHNNPSVIPILSIGLAYRDYSSFSSMVSHASYRKSFIKSSIEIARFYGFHGLDLSWLWPNTSFVMKNIGILLDEWRAAIDSDSRNFSSTEPKLILTMAIYRLPFIGAVSFPIESIRRNLDWAHIIAFDYHLPLKENVTGNHAALYDNSSNVSTDFGIKEWLKRGLPPKKLVLGVPFHGYAWTKVNPDKNSIDATASGPYLTKDGSVGYKYIKSLILNYGYGHTSIYNATYVVNHFSIRYMWINFDDVEAIRTKILYAKTKGLLGYNAFQLANDDDWHLSRAAYEVGENEEKKKQLGIIASTPIAVVILLLLFGSVSYYLTNRKLKLKGEIGSGQVSSSKAGPNTQVNENSHQIAPNLKTFTYSEIKAAACNFSCENRLGEGGYGPVYKGKLAKGQEIAVKRLSKTSNQGYKEFKNEVKLASKLQHVNILRLLGFCTQRGEKMLIYEYMPNKSLDFYLFDPSKRLKLKWEQMVHIIEGIVQGLIYLQEYSNLTIIHRDIKASNILLDNMMKPKISDFGMARIFQKENNEANTGQLVGTYGYVPPEYVKRGVYSMKYDVYSFGVLLLQIISGKKNACFYGPNENLNLLEHAYELWKADNSMEFIDATLDDSFSSWKVLRCLQVGLLCVQESPMDRPSTLEVYSMLKNEKDTTPCPKRPAFSVEFSGDEGNRSILCKEIYSINEVTVSEMVPR